MADQECCSTATAAKPPPPPGDRPPLEIVVKKRKSCPAGVICFIVPLVLISVFCALLFLPQRNPSFTIEDLAVDNFSTFNTDINISMHFTISSKEPSSMTVNYNRIEASAMYHGSIITDSTPVLLDGPGSMSVDLKGAGVAVDPALAAALDHDLMGPGAPIHVSLRGWIRKKMFWSIKDGFIVDCLGLLRLNGSAVETGQYFVANDESNQWMRLMYPGVKAYRWLSCLTPCNFNAPACSKINCLWNIPLV